MNPEAARRARYRYACFDHMAEDSQTYGYAASVGIRPDCQDEVIDTTWKVSLKTLLHKASRFGVLSDFYEDTRFQPHARSLTFQVV